MRFSPMSSSSSPPHCHLAILSSLITSPVIKSPVFAKPSKRAMPVSGSCQPTPPISIRLSRASPKSRRAYARPNLAAARPCGTKQAASFKTLPQTNAPTSWHTQAMYTQPETALDVDGYLRGQSNWLVNYAKRYRANLRVGTSITEGTANFLVNRRMNKSQQMRWSRRGADLLLQVRCAVYNGTFD